MNIVRQGKKATKEQLKVYEAFNKNQLTAAEAQNTKNKFSNDISLLPEVVLESICYSSKLKNRESVPKIKYPTSDTQISETPYDGRLGSDESRVICDTCMQVCNNCTGHMGIIELPFSLIQPYYREYLVKVLRCICINCKYFILTKDAMVSEGIGNNLKGFPRLNKIASISDKRSCPNGHKNVIFKQTEAASNKNYQVKYNIRTSDKTERIEYLSVNKIISILEEADRINGGFKLLGFEQDNTPLNFITDFIPVISKSSRSRSYKDNIAKDDFLTTAYNQIIAKINSTETEQKNNILFYYSHLMNNERGEYMQPNESKEPIISIKDRITGKDRLIRKYMLSTRTNFSGRTVAGINSQLKFGEVSPPRLLESQIGKREIVTKYNIDRIKKMILEGKVVSFKPSVKKEYWRRTNENYIDMIEPGHVVQRWTIDGDICIINRQPTLHRQSMLSCRVKFLSDRKTCSVHLSNTSGLNMDFDGDEANMHILQSSESEVEALTFNAVDSAVSSYTYPGIIPALTYNSLAGIYLLSKEKISLEDFNILIRQLNEFPSKKLKAENLAKEGHSYSYSLLSSLFPDDFSYENNGIIIKKGVFIKGEITSSFSGKGSSSVLVYLKKFYNKQVYCDFISIANFLANMYIQMSGLTVSLKDVELEVEGPEGEKNWKEWKNNLIDNINQEVLDLPHIENPTEFEINERENDISTYIIGAKMASIDAFVMANLKPDNPLKIMNKSGAKGKTENLISIISHKGNQLTNNKRPEKTLSRGRRWRHTFSVDDMSIYSRGFARNSYFDGLNQDEFWANAQGSRVNLTDTSIKTADIGAIERRMVKAMEDLISTYDGSVRNSRGAVFQFSFGLGFSSDQLIIDKNRKMFFIDLEQALHNVNTEFES